MFDWDEVKNEILKRERGISFEEVVFWLENDGILKVEDHPNQRKYPGQRVYMVNIENYVYVVPFVEEKGIVFLKTIIPSRKATKTFLKGASDASD